MDSRDVNCIIVNFQAKNSFRTNTVSSSGNSFRRWLDDFLIQKEQEENVQDESNDEQEDSVGYSQGGYLPVKVGDIFQRRYRAVNKLGWGYFSTVWLCWDLLGHRFVAIKIVNSALNFKAAAQNEVEIHKAVCESRPQDFKKVRLVQLLSHFTIIGVNGTHICMVFDVFGPNLHELRIRSKNRRIPLPHVKSLIRQVLEGLDFLHTKCKIIHTDIKPENILLCANDSYIRDLTLKATKNRSGESLISSASNELQCNLIYSLIKLQSLKNSLKSENVSMDLDESRKGHAMVAVIANLGNACRVNQPLTKLIQTRPYRSPEVIIGAGYNTSADIWSTACMAFELATGDCLFNVENNTQHLAKIVELLGDIPQHIIKQGSMYRRYFNRRGQLQRISCRSRMNLCDVLTDKYDWAPDEANNFTSFILPMLKYDCRTRATPAKCLQHPWLKD